jgi:hypothetical protein
MEDQTLKNQIKSLLLRGFNKEEIKSLLNLGDDKLINRCIKESSNSNIDDNSVELYSELQKDLSKLVFTEMQNKDKKDPTVILNAIRLQAELQEKKINISKGNKGNREAAIKISKKYIYDRDEEIANLKEQGLPAVEIASKFGISEVSVGWSIDRFNLSLPEHLKVLSPSTISETMGIPKEDRITLLQQALDKGLTKMQVREIVNNIKNQMRSK